MKANDSLLKNTAGTPDIMMIMSIFAYASALVTYTVNTRTGGYHELINVTTA